MSFDIQWDNVCNDTELALSFRDFLNSKLSTVELPHYLANLQVVDFKFGKTAPEITIRDIDVPFDEFYTEGGKSDDNSDEDEELVNNDNNTNNEYRNNNNNYIKNKLRKKIKNKIKETNQIDSVPMTPRGVTQFFNNSTYNSSRSASPHPFMNGNNSLLIPRTNSGFTQTMGQYGVGLAGFGMAGGNNSNNNQIISQSNDSINSNSNLENNYFVRQDENKDDFLENGKMFNNLLKGMSNVHLTTTDSFINGSDNENENEDNSSNDGNEKNNNYGCSDGLDKSLDIQLSMDLNWDSQLYIELTCNLLVNYPAPEFIRLPVRLKITGLKIHSLMILAYISKKVFISFLCDIDDEINTSEINDEIQAPDSFNSNINNYDSRQDSKRSNPTNYKNQRTKGKERIDILQDMKIEGEIGNLTDINSDIWKDHESSLKQDKYNLPINTDNVNVSGQSLNVGISGFSTTDEFNDNNGLVLRNIGKIEKFLISAFRGLIIDELAWPGWIELDFNEVIEEESEEEKLMEEGLLKNNKNDVESKEPNLYYEEAIMDESSDEENYQTREKLSTVHMNRTSSRISSRASRTRRRLDSYADESSAYSSDSYFTSDGE
jgi:distribution and morphology protein 12